MSFLVKIGIAVFLLCMTLAAPAQDAEKREKGRFTGSLESNTILYVSDHAIHADGESQAFGSNNYLKGDYTRGRFSAGFQMEYYPDRFRLPLLGERAAEVFVRHRDCSGNKVSEAVSEIGVDPAYHYLV